MSTTIIYSKSFIAIRRNRRRKTLSRHRDCETVPPMIKMHNSFSKASWYRKVHLFANKEIILRTLFYYRELRNIFISHALFTPDILRKIIFGI